MMLRAADIAQLFFRRLLEPFDANSVEVREHREHSSMELLQTRNESGVDGRKQTGGRRQTSSQKSEARRQESEGRMLIGPNGWRFGQGEIFVHVGNVAHSH